MEEKKKEGEKDRDRDTCITYSTGAHRREAGGRREGNGTSVTKNVCFGRDGYGCCMTETKIMNNL